MKITIALLLITLGLVCSAYAAPAPPGTKAEMQSWLDFAYKVRHALDSLGKFPTGEAQDYDDDNDAKMQIDWSSFLKRTMKVVPHVLNGGEADRAELQGFMDFLKRNMKVTPHVIDALTGGEAQDYDDDDNDAMMQINWRHIFNNPYNDAPSVSRIEAVLQRLEDEAKVQGFWDVAKHIARTVGKK